MPENGTPISATQALMTAATIYAGIRVISILDKGLARSYKRREARKAAKSV